MIVTFFRLNGVIDLFIQVLFSVTAFVMHSTNLVSDSSNFIWLPAPLAMTTIGLILYNYLAAREQSKLFLLERVSNLQNAEQLNTIEMLPGSVIIMNKDLKTVMFRNQKNFDIDWLTTN